MEDKPGVDGEEFKITLNKDYFNQPKLLSFTMFEYKCRIIKVKRYQWYWRVLYYLTFKKYFDIKYELEIIRGPKLETE